MGELKVESSAICGVYKIQSSAHTDNRGCFSRLYCSEELNPLLNDLPIVQVNLSTSFKKGTLRGLHYQNSPHAEFKLVRCINGRILDVVVDLRCNSKTYLQHVTAELCPEQNSMMLIAPGCAHGFQALTDNAQLLYMHTATYQPAAEAGVRFNDPLLNIDWPLPARCISDRDLRFAYLDNKFEGIRI